MQRTRRLLPTVTSAVCFALLALVGCGPPQASVKGKIVLPPGLTLQKEDTVAVSFLPVNKSAGLVGGLANYDPANQTFVAKTSELKGLSPGDYKISVQITPYGGSQDSTTRAQQFQPINDKYGPENTPLKYTVTDGSQNLTIDVDKGAVTKN